MGNKIQSLESILLTTLKRKKHFFTHKTDKDMTALASYYKKKIKTEKMLAINQHSGKVQKIIKVTIL